MDQRIKIEHDLEEIINTKISFQDSHHFYTNINEQVMKSNLLSIINYKRYTLISCKYNNCTYNMKVIPNIKKEYFKIKLSIKFSAFTIVGLFKRLINIVTFFYYLIVPIAVISLKDEILLNNSTNSVITQIIKILILPPLLLAVLLNILKNLKIISQYTNFDMNIIEMLISIFYKENNDIDFCINSLN